MRPLQPSTGSRYDTLSNKISMRDVVALMHRIKGKCEYVVGTTRSYTLQDTEKWQKDYNTLLSRHIRSLKNKGSDYDQLTETEKNYISIDLLRQQYWIEINSKGPFATPKATWIADCIVQFSKSNIYEFAFASYDMFRKDLVSRHGLYCAYCEVPLSGFHVEHKLPKSVYPELEMEPSNLLLSCLHCNTSKNAQVPPPSNYPSSIVIHKDSIDLTTDGLNFKYHIRDLEASLSPLIDEYLKARSTTYYSVKYKVAFPDEYIDFSSIYYELFFKYGDNLEYCKLISSSDLGNITIDMSKHDCVTGQFNGVAGCFELHVASNDTALR